MIYQMIMNHTRSYHGGWGEIRTHDARKGTSVFKTDAFNRSATHPQGVHLYTDAQRWGDLAYECL